MARQNVFSFAVVLFSICNFDKKWNTKKGYVVNWIKNRAWNLHDNHNQKNCISVPSADQSSSAFKCAALKI